jgi:hypothetical protein
VIYLADTNILLRLADRAHGLHALVRTAVRKLRAGGHPLRAATQNFVEFWNAATRPLASNGWGLPDFTRYAPEGIVAVDPHTV